MIYIATAMYAEAHPFITRFQLKKEISHTRFQVFLNKEADLCLIISGTGMIPAAAAVSSICTEYGAGQGDFLLNVGVCGQIWNRNSDRTENPCQMGKLFLCNKIKEQITGKTFYPDMLYRHRFAEARIVTGPKPYTETAPAETELSEETEFFLYDMEASAVYQTGACYLGPHRMSFLKAVSDDGNGGKVTPGQIECLIGNNMEALADYMAVLRRIIHEECQEDIFQESRLQENLAKLCRDLHCSRVMSESVRQYLRYCILSGVDYASVLEEMYREGKLPCRDKREGKQCFDELKERLL